MAGTKTSNGLTADDASVMLKMKESKIRILEEQVGGEGPQGDYNVADVIFLCRLGCEDYYGMLLQLRTTYEISIDQAPRPINLENKRNVLVAPVSAPVSPLLGRRRY